MFADMSVLFDGVDDQVQGNSDTELDNLAQGTVSYLAWVKNDSTQGDHGSLFEKSSNFSVGMT